MIIVTPATDEERPDWDSFVDASEDAESYHPYQWRKVFERVFGHDCYYLIARDSGNVVVGVLPLFN